MIDYRALQYAYENDQIYSLQLEVGDVCYQGCIYCYMNALEEVRNTLSDLQIEHILQDSARLNVKAVEWLGGEPLLRESIFDHMELASNLKLRNNVWTGGLPLSDTAIRRKLMQSAYNGLIAVHVSSIRPSMYKRLHPSRSEDDLNTILLGVERLLESGYPATQMLNSVTLTGLQSAADMLETIDYFEREFSIKTSLNVYHTYLRPGTPHLELKKFIPDRDRVKRVYERYAEQWGMIAYPMNCVNKQYCCSTAAVLCNGSVTPCATIRPHNAPNIHSSASFMEIVNNNLEWLIFKRFKDIKNLPYPCQVCEFSEQCFGCRSRAYAANLGMYGIDPRCYRWQSEN